MWRLRSRKIHVNGANVWPALSFKYTQVSTSFRNSFNEQGKFIYINLAKHSSLLFDEFREFVFLANFMKLVNFGNLVKLEKLADNSANFHVFLNNQN